MVLCPRILARPFSHQAWGAWGGAWASKLKLCVMSQPQRLPFTTKAGCSTGCLNTRHENNAMKTQPVPNPVHTTTSMFEMDISVRYVIVFIVRKLSNISFCSLKITLKQSFQIDRVLKFQIQYSSECGERFKPIYWFPFWFKYIQNKWQKFIRKCHSAKECCSNKLLEPFTISNFVHSDNYYLTTV